MDSISAMISLVPKIAERLNCVPANHRKIIVEHSAEWVIAWPSPNRPNARQTPAVHRSSDPVAEDEKWNCLPITQISQCIAGNPAHTGIVVLQKLDQWFCCLPIAKFSEGDG